MLKSGNYQSCHYMMICLFGCYLFIINEGEACVTEENAPSWSATSGLLER